MTNISLGSLEYSTAIDVNGKTIFQILYIFQLESLPNLKV